MDKEGLLQWIDEILKPYIATVPPGVVPLLFLDSYKCHLMAEVVNKIQDLGVEVDHIPGGCTGLTQPVDIGINKPLKNMVRHKWEEYMLEEGMLHDNKTKPPTRQVLAKWCIEAMSGMDEEIVKNSWLHGEYSFFPADVAARSAAKADAATAFDQMLGDDDDDDDDEEDDDADDDEEEEEEMVAAI
jgi:hypothetical protein